MRVLINRAVVKGPWGGGNNFVAGMRRWLPDSKHVVVDSLSQRPDVVLLIGPQPDALGVGFNDALVYKRSNPCCKIVLRVNECDARKGTQGVDAALLAAATKCDSVIFVSEWLKQHTLKSWSTISGQSPESIRALIECDHVIHNGVDRTVFRPLTSSTKRSILDVVTHHWSDNPLKGRDVYEHVDSMSACSFTYIGRHQCTFKNSTTRVVPPLFGQDLARELASHDVYVTGTRFDPAPNHVLEALACGLPVWSHVNGGGAVEFAGEDHTFESLDDLTAKLSSPEIHEHNSYVPSDWSECAQKYSALFEEIS